MKIFGKDLKFLLVHTCGLALCVGLIAGCVRPSQAVSQKPHQKKKVFLSIPATGHQPVLVRRDTIYVKTSDFKKVGNYVGGEYVKGENVVKLRYYCDTNAVCSDRNFVRKINRIHNASDYHEVRHAVNNYFIGRVENPDPMLFVANEFYALAGQGLARYMNLPPLADGYIDMDVDYRTADRVLPMVLAKPVYEWDWADNAPSIIVTDEMRAAADSALNFAVNRFSHVFQNYNSIGFNDGTKDIYIKSARQNRKNLINRTDAMDSLRVFRINGRRVDITKIASENAAMRADTFFNRFVPNNIKQPKNNGR